MHVRVKSLIDYTVWPWVARPVIKEVFKKIEENMGDAGM